MGPQGAFLGKRTLASWPFGVLARRKGFRLRVVSKRDFLLKPWTDAPGWSQVGAGLFEEAAVTAPSLILRRCRHHQPLWRSHHSPSRVPWRPVDHDVHLHKALKNNDGVQSNGKKWKVRVECTPWLVKVIERRRFT